MKKLFVLFAFVVSAVLVQAQEMSRPKLDTGNVAEALKLYENEDVAGAVDLLLKEIEVDAKNGYAYFYLAYIFQCENGESLGLEESEVEMVQAPTFLLLYYDFALKKLPKKDKYFRSLCYVYQSFVFRNEETYDLANEALDDALKLYDNSSFITEKGQNYILMEEFDKAEQAFVEANRKDESPNNYLGLAITYINVGKYDEAIEMANKVLAYDDEHYDYALAQIARAYIGKGDFENALEPAISSYLLGGGNLAWDMLLILFDEIPEQVVAKAKIALVKLSDDVEVKLKIKDLLARAYVELGDHRNAIKYGLEVYNELPEYFYACALVTTSYYELGEYDEALVFVDKLIALDTTNAAVYRLKSNIYYAMADLDKAVDVVNIAISMDPEDASFYLTRGKFYRYMGRVDEAIDDYMMVVTLNPDDSYAYIQRGVLLKQQGKNVLAEEDFRKAIELDSMNNECMSMCYGYLFLGEKEKAIETFVKCYDEKMIDDYNAACLFSLMGEKNMALRYLERSLDLGNRDFAHIGFDTDLDNIREMPEFKVLIEKYRNR